MSDNELTVVRSAGTSPNEAGVWQRTHEVRSLCFRPIPLLAEQRGTERQLASCV